MTTPFSLAQRSQAAALMNANGLNKCDDCCLVPTCPTCGPCGEHGNAVEVAAAMAWAEAARVDGIG